MINNSDSNLHSATLQIIQQLLEHDADWANPILFFSHPDKLQHDGEISYFAANPTRSITGTSLNSLKQQLAETLHQQQPAHKSQAAHKAQLSSTDKPEFCSGWAGSIHYPSSPSNCQFELHYYPWVIQIDNHSGKIELTGTPDPQAIELFERLSSAAGATKVADALKNTNTPKNADAPFICSQFEYAWSEKQYKEAFTQVQHYLNAGDCYQINLTHPAWANYSGNPLHAAQDLFEQTAPSFGSYFKGKQSTLISLSPERLVKIQASGAMQAKPIKGTILRSKDHDLDAIQQHTLINSKKDQAENLMIVDLLRNDLSQSALPGSVKVDKLFELETHPYVHHLVSTVSAQLKEASDPITALTQIFPGGSITGAPKKRAMEIIDELEPQARSLYCGSIGYISDSGDMDFNILIRSLEFKDGKVWCWGGGGITVDSEAESEYQESLTKTEKIRKVLESFN